MARNPVARGAEIELLVAARVIELDGIALFPFGHAQGYDLVSDVGGYLRRIQVRRAWRHHQRDRWEVGVHEIVTVYEDGARRQRKTPCTGKHYDLLVVAAGDEWYVIPAERIAGRSALTMRPPSCRQKSQDSGAAPSFDIEQFRAAWHLIQGDAK